MRLSAGARLYADRLKLDPLVAHHVIPCPFHRDADPSLSIDMDRGVFYCHGACPEPKGGGPIQFILRWAAMIEKDPITRDQARRRLARSFTKPSAQELSAAWKRERVTAFVEHMVGVYAARAASIERTIRALDDSSCFALDDTDPLWNVYASLYHQLTMTHGAWEVCFASLPKSDGRVVHHPDLPSVVALAVARGDWDHTASLNATLVRAAASVVKRRQALHRKANPECRPLVPLEPPSPPSPGPKPSRTPVL